MARKLTGPDVLASDLEGAETRTLVQGTERLIAVGYGLVYDAVVSGFPPYEALVEEVLGYVARTAPAARTGPAPSILDVSCGIGTIAARVAARGYDVTGLDAVGHLIEVARRRHGNAGGRLRFAHVDAGVDTVPGAGAYDALVSMHTLYWHSRPDALLAACRRALKPGGHAVFLTYARPARLGPTFAQVRAQAGLGQAIRALRWLAPTALFETLRDVNRRYLSEAEFHAALRTAGFEILEARATFLAGISRLAWVRAPR